MLRQLAGPLEKPQQLQHSTKKRLQPERQQDSDGGCKPGGAKGDSKRRKGMPQSRQEVRVQLHSGAQSPFLIADPIAMSTGEGPVAHSELPAWVC